MAGFSPASTFQPAQDDLQLLPTRFERLPGDRFIVGNLLGDMAFMDGADLRRLAALDLAPGDGLYETAFEKLLVAKKGDEAQLQLLALRLRSRMAFLRAATPLHLFGSCPIAWCSFGDVITALSGLAGLVRRPGWAG